MPRRKIAVITFHRDGDICGEIFHSVHGSFEDAIEFLGMEIPVPMFEVIEIRHGNRVSECYSQVQKKVTYFIRERDL